MKWRWDRLAAKSSRAAPLKTTCRCEQHVKVVSQAGTGTGILSEANSIRSTHRSHSLWLKGLQLKAAAAMLVVLPSPFLARFPLLPSTPPVLSLPFCPSDSHTSWENIPRTMHQLTHQGLRDGGKRPGCRLERRWTCVRSVPWDPCQLTQGKSLDDGNGGVRRGKPLSGFIIEAIHL